MIVIAIIGLVFTLLFGIYFIIAMPRLKDRADMDMLVTDYAHRGLWGDGCPENSMSAFARAIDIGVGIELDVQLSADKRVVVFHDADLLRICGVDRKVSSMNYSELSKLKLLATEQTLPTLAEVLKLVDGKVPLLIELKGKDRDTEICRRVTALLDKYSGAFAVKSFDPIKMCWFKKFRPRYARGQIVAKLKFNKKTKVKSPCGSRFFGFALSNMLVNIISRPDFISVDGNMRKHFMIRLFKRFFGTKVFVWTVRSKRDYDNIRRDGYYPIFEKITNL